MAHFKVGIRTDSQNLKKDGTANIKIKLCHKGQERDLSTKYYIRPNQLKNGKVIRHGNAALINLDIQRKMLDYEEKILTKLGTRIDDMSIKDLLAFLKEEKTYICFFDYMEKHADKLKQIAANNNDSEKYAGLIMTSLNALKDFVKKPTIRFEDVNYSLIVAFQNHLKKKGLSNGINNYMISIRTVWNSGANEHDNRDDPYYIDRSYYPFKRYKIIFPKTRKRNISIEEFAKLFYAEKSEKEQEAFDMLMLSIFTVGLNLKDLFGLKKPWNKSTNELVNGRIEFYRSKTGRPHSIKVEPEAMDILNKYKGDVYIMKFAEHFVRYESFSRKVTEYLKDLSLREIKREITFYWGRHTWQTWAANNVGIRSDIRSRAMGHAGNRMTEIYTEYDYAQIDEANRKLIDYINNSLINYSEK